jgi:hypothetical protein
MKKRGIEIGQSLTSPFRNSRSSPAIAIKKKLKSTIVSVASRLDGKLKNFWA